MGTLKKGKQGSAMQGMEDLTNPPEAVAEASSEAGRALGETKRRGQDSEPGGVV
jgi:hypothetical protein